VLNITPLNNGVKYLLARLHLVSTICLHIRPCLGTKFLKTTVFEIVQYTLVMTIPQFTIPQF
jgi:hypothetical protein